MNYNLLDEEWIPVLYHDGRYQRVGIRKALEEAGQMRQIAASNPMDRVAILRFLLALLYWSRGSPSDDSDTSGMESFPPDWSSKLEANRECFNLLGEGKRFYQCHAVEPCADKNKNHEIIPLIQEVPNGDDKWHFRHSTDKVDGFCLACCALSLLRLPMFASQEGRGWHQGINGVPPVYVMSIGKTLWETLVLNWVPSQSIGEPSWIQADVRPNRDLHVPLLMGLTTLARRIWLHGPADRSRACIACGSRETGIIRTCEYQSSGPLRGEHWTDPHVLYLDKTPRRTVKADDLTAAGKFKMDRPWPSLLSHMVRSNQFGARESPVSLLVVGFATDHAKNIDAWERTVSVRSAVSIKETVTSSLSLWQKSVSSLARKLEPPSEKKSSRKHEHMEISSTFDAVRPHVEGKVSQAIEGLLADEPSAWQEAAAKYRPMMRAIAKSLSPGFTTMALQKRRRIASALPDMQTQAKEPQKPKRKKGEDK